MCNFKRWLLFECFHIASCDCPIRGVSSLLARQHCQAFVILKRTSFKTKSIKWIWPKFVKKNEVMACVRAYMLSSSGDLKDFVIKEKNHMWQIIYPWMQQFILFSHFFRPKFSVGVHWLLEYTWSTWLHHIEDFAYNLQKSNVSVPMQVDLTYIDL